MFEVGAQRLYTLMFRSYTCAYVMENYRRPAPVKSGARQAVDGYIPNKTKTADPKIQPFRDAAIKQAATPVKRAPPIDMSLPDGESFNRHHMTPAVRRNVRRVRTMVLRTALVGMALFVGLGSVLISQGYFNLHKVFNGSAATAVSLQTNVDPNLLKGEGDGRINILLSGIGGADHSGGDLTDTLMLMSIDPVNNTAALLSIPRDLWVTLPGKGGMKINAAYETGKFAYLHKVDIKNQDSKAIGAGFTSLDQTVEKVLGVPINYNMQVNFNAFSQAVDTVGGVNVDVPTDLYDPTMAWENNKDPYLARAGTQAFDGKHALIYVRSRETSSDFARSQRQRAVLLALKQKAVTLGVLANPTKLSGLLGAFGTNVHTDLSVGDASRLYSIFKRINNNDIKSVSLAGTISTTSSAAGLDSLITTGNINRQSIVMPKAGLENYNAIQDYVHTQLKDGYLTKERAKVKVLNGTIEKNLGQTESDKLKRYGYNVIGSGSAPSTGYPNTVVVDLSHGKNKYTKHYLEQRYGVTAVSKLPDATIQPGNTDFVVILGGDETGTN